MRTEEAGEERRREKASMGGNCRSAGSRSEGAWPDCDPGKEGREEPREAVQGHPAQAKTRQQ